MSDQAEVLEVANRKRINNMADEIERLTVDLQMAGEALGEKAQRIAHLEKTIADADHSPQCRNTQHEPPWKCDCWKSRVT